MKKIIGALLLLISVESWAVIDRPYSLREASVGALYERPLPPAVMALDSVGFTVGDARWHVQTGRLFLGIDHTAILVNDTDASLKFYRDTLGLRPAGESENYGIPVPASSFWNICRRAMDALILPIHAPMTSFTGKPILSRLTWTPSIWMKREQVSDEPCRYAILMATLQGFSKSEQSYEC